MAKISDSTQTKQSSNDRERITWNPLSFATVSWIYPILQKGTKMTLKEESLPLLRSVDSAETLAEWLLDVGPGHSIFWMLWKRIGKLHMLTTLCTVYNIVCSIGTSLCLIELLNCLDGTAQVIQNTYILVALMCGLQIGSIVSNAVSKSLYQIISIRLTAALTSAIYAKNFKISFKDKSAFNNGTVMNLISTDVPNLTIVGLIFNYMISIPLQAILSIYFLVVLLGGISTAFALSMVLFGIIGPAVTRIYFVKHHRRYIEIADKRFQSVQEFLREIKFIKYAVLEESKMQDMENIRRGQILAVKKKNLFDALGVALLHIQECISVPLVIVIYIKLGNYLSPNIIYPAWSLLVGIHELTVELPGYLQEMGQAKVSYDRIVRYLNTESVHRNEIITFRENSNSDCAIELADASFAWTGQNDTESGDFKLTGVNVKVKRGHLVAVVGASGSGKSTLLSALAGLVPKIRGQGRVSGTIGYCSQIPEIFSGTVKDNITLFGAHGENCLQHAVNLCELSQDMKKMKNGLGTRIGENGTKLSGGQKARVCLARAIAKDPDVYLLDDPLSSLDAHVSRRIFTQVIRGKPLQNKTIILATQMLHFLPSCDEIIVMSNGQVVQQGTFPDLMKDTNGKLYDIVKEYSFDEDAVLIGQNQETCNVLNDSNAEDEVVAENRQQGNVSYATWKEFLCSISKFDIVAIFVSFTICIGINVFQFYALASWIGNLWNLPTMYYMYISLGSTILLVTLNGSIFLSVLNLGTNASQSIYLKAMICLSSAPVSFFENQPSGQILNRIMNDVSSNDFGLGARFGYTMNLLITFLTSFIIVCIAAYQIIPVCGFLIICSLYIFKFYKKSYADLRRMAVMAQSPIISHFSESLNCCSTILCYNAQAVFSKILWGRLNAANGSALILKMSAIWIKSRFELLSALVYMSVLLLAVVNALPADFLGLAVAMMPSLASSLRSLIYNATDLEQKMISVERLNYYAFNLPEEAARVLPKDSKLEKWPESGSIKLENLSLAYDVQPDHVVIDDISVDIKSGEKIGIIGRTGAGKSTLMDAFFRLQEAKGGKILIDGEDISTIGLKKLRGSLKLIPQNPTLFVGSFRSNIDETGLHTDTEIWHALKSVGMHEYVSQLPNKLDSTICESGSNLSAGQRQLMCFARIILQRDAKIVIFDEATSSVDNESDIRIREIIQNSFKDATVLSVAHRLNTIAAFDKIMVLEKGKVAEFSSPQDLLANTDSIFSGMVEATGSANALLIREIVDKSARLN